MKIFHDTQKKEGGHTVCINNSGIVGIAFCRPEVLKERPQYYPLNNREFYLEKGDPFNRSIGRAIAIGKANKIEEFIVDQFGTVERFYRLPPDKQKYELMLIYQRVYSGRALSNIKRIRENKDNYGTMVKRVLSGYEKLEYLLDGLL